MALLTGSSHMTSRRRLALALLVLVPCLFERGWGAIQAPGRGVQAGGSGSGAGDGAPPLPPAPPPRLQLGVWHLPMHRCWTHRAALSNFRVTCPAKCRLCRIPCRAAVAALLQLKAALTGWDPLVARHNISLTGWRTPIGPAAAAAGTAGAHDALQEADPPGACQWTFVECDAHGRVARL